VKPKPKEWTEAEKQALIRLVCNGASMREIKAKLKRHAGSLKRMAREMNLVLKK
jgi:transposase-like protein